MPDFLTSDPANNGVYLVSWLGNGQLSDVNPKAAFYMIEIVRKNEL